MVSRVAGRQLGTAASPRRFLPHVAAADVGGEDPRVLAGQFEDARSLGTTLHDGSERDCRLAETVDPGHRDGQAPLRSCPTAASSAGQSGTT